MLKLTEPVYFINGLEIRQDFQNDQQFYFFPAAPRIHMRDGKPEFQLLKYARDVTDNPNFPPETREQVGGGFVVFTVDIGVDEAMLEDTRNKLSSQVGGSVQLSPVPFHNGTARLVALGANEDTVGQPPEGTRTSFVQKVFGTTKPSLYGDNLALFGMHLDQEGIVLLEDSFRHGGGLVGVLYDLVYTGIRPALQVKAHVDFERVYNRFEAQLGLQYATIGAEIGAQLEWLREQRAIEIEITQYDADAAAIADLRREAMTLIQQEVIAKMFQPSLQVPQAATGSQANPLEQVMRIAQQLRSGASGSLPEGNAPQPAGTVTEGEPGPSTMERRQAGAPAAGGAGASPGFALTFSLKYVRQEERKTMDFDFQVNQAANRNAAPQGSLHLLTEAINIDECIRSVQMDDPFFNELRAEIGVTGDWETLGIERVVVNAAYQPDPAGPVVHTDGWVFSTPNEASKFFNVLLDRNRPTREYRYKTQVFLKNLDNVDSRDGVLTTEAATEQRELLINPANEFRPLLIRVESGITDWTAVQRVDVILRYSDPANHFETDHLFAFLENQQGPFRWVVYPEDRDLRSYTVAYRYTLRSEQGGTMVYERPAETRTDEGLVVPMPFRGERRVRLVPAVDRAEVQDITAEVLFEKNGYRFHRFLEFGAGNFAPQTIRIPVPDPDPETDIYKVRWSLMNTNFETFEVDWSDHREERVMLHDGVHTVRPVQVMLVQPPERLGLNAILFQMESLAPDGSVVDRDQMVVQGPETRLNFDLMLMKDTPLRYRYSVTKFLPDNTNVVVGPIESQDTELFVTL